MSERVRSTGASAKRLGLIVAALAVGVVGAVVVRDAIAGDAEPVVIVHWANSHPMRDGLLSDMAESFNKAHHTTPSGHPVEVVVIKCDSAVQADDLVARSTAATRAADRCGDGSTGSNPTIVTPQSDDWLVDINHRAGGTVIDLAATKNIAETWLGIVTYREMASCLGWPERAVGYADLVALGTDPDGWAAHPDCADVSWGREPLLAFTNPRTSTSGRNVLVTLYALAAGKTPGELTLADVQRPEVIQSVEEFQHLVKHYMPGTIPLNTKVEQGERYGHFFLMPEDNLANLYLGTEQVTGSDGTTKPVAPQHDLVMIYPKEGSVLNANPAGVVEAAWVTPEQVEAANVWIDHLRSEEQQRRFGAAGFRSPRDLNQPIDADQFAQWGLRAEPPSVTIEPGDLRPDVLQAIIGSWGDVKKPAIVTFVVDTSGSMHGEPLEQVKQGLLNVVDAMAPAGRPAGADQVGLITFSDTVHDVIPPGPIDTIKFDIADAVDGMHASGDTALFSAIAQASELTANTDGDEDALRAVVVLSDGEATSGRCLDTVIELRTIDELPVQFCGTKGADATSGGAKVDLDDVVGYGLATAPSHEVQIFFLGFGNADFDIGRLLAQATDAEYQGQTEADLAKVIEQLSGYF